VSNETLKLFLKNLRKSAEFNRTHSSISVDRYAAICDVAFALECAIETREQKPVGSTSDARVEQCTCGYKYESGKVEFHVCP